MTTATAPALPERGLAQQGFDYTPEELRELSWGLRFTPFMCMLGALYGLAFREPAANFLMGAMGIGSVFFPAHHPMDLLYNHLLRPLWGGVRLPPNPFPRRIACLVGGSMNVGIGLAFLYGVPTVAWVLGAILVPLQIIVISTHFCVASWLYEVILRLVGAWAAPGDPAQMRQLVAEGAALVDVREPDEFAHGHISGAVNIPLDSLEARLDSLGNVPVVLYCASGMRSQRACALLRSRHGRDDVHNLGAMTRWG